jgi:hypothetical protein
MPDCELEPSEADSKKESAEILIGAKVFQEKKGLLHSLFGSQVS